MTTYGPCGVGVIGIGVSVGFSVGASVSVAATTTGSVDASASVWVGSIDCVWVAVPANLPLLARQTIANATQQTNRRLAPAIHQMGRFKDFAGVGADGVGAGETG